MKNYYLNNALQRESMDNVRFDGIPTGISRNLVLKNEPIPLIFPVIDQQEKKPYIFKQAIRKYLKTGDYSLEGLEDEMTVERKSLEDWIGSMTIHREREERKFQRMSEMSYSALVLESTIDEMKAGVWVSKTHPNSVINTALGWCLKYRMHLFFVGGWNKGNQVTKIILWEYYKNREKRIKFFGVKNRFVMAGIDAWCDLDRDTIYLLGEEMRSTPREKLTEMIRVGVEKDCSFLWCGSVENARDVKERLEGLEMRYE